MGGKLDHARLMEAAGLAQGAEPARARPLVARLLAEHPGHPDVLTLAGLVAQRTGDDAGALDAFARARAGDPANPARIGNHALALKTAGRFDEAIAALTEADRLRPDHPGTLANLGSCLIAAGRPAEAEAPLKRAVARNPESAEGWNNLGVVHARAGRHAEASAAYARALAARPGWDDALVNRAEAELALGNPAAAATLAAAVREPGHPRAADIRARAAEAEGRSADALAIYEAGLAARWDATLAHNATLAALVAGEAETALALANRMLAASSAVTTPLAYVLAALARLDRAEDIAALVDLDRFVTVIDHETPPADFASMEAFHAALAEELAAHPSLTFEPAGLVTRGGRQSDELARAETPAIAALAGMARAGIARVMAGLDGAAHPWLAARPQKWDLTMWGTILAPGGAVDPHIHAPNWLSGAYYPALPGAVSDGSEGAFAIGLLPPHLGPSAPLRTVAAKPGRMVLFPSFLWHATLPFGGHEPRISFAFDAMPEGIGQPHRLPA